MKFYKLYPQFQKFIQWSCLPTKLHHKKIVALLFITLLLDACQYIKRPEYWNCFGTNIQVVVNKNDDHLELYEGNQQLMIEVFNQSVSQFASAATFGRYDLCLNNAEKLIFKFPNCKFSDLTEDTSIPYKRIGVLNRENGIFTFAEIRTLEHQKIISSGSYSCHYLGNSYTYKDMSLENDY